MRRTTLSIRETRGRPHGAGDKEVRYKGSVQEERLENMTVMREVDAVSSTLSCFVFFLLVSALPDT
jgi:hypothetical protein